MNNKITEEIEEQEVVPFYPFPKECPSVKMSVSKINVFVIVLHGQKDEIERVYYSLYANRGTDDKEIKWIDPYFTTAIMFSSWEKLKKYFFNSYILQNWEYGMKALKKQLVPKNLWRAAKTREFIEKRDKIQIKANEFMMEKVKELSLNVESIYYTDDLVYA